MLESAKEGVTGLSEGSDIGLGCGGREFEPRHSDQKSSETERFRGFFIPFQPFSLSIAIQILLGLEYNNQIKLAKDNPQK